MKTRFPTRTLQALAVALALGVLSTAAPAMPTVNADPAATASTTPIALPPPPLGDETVGELVIDGHWG